MRIPPLDIPAGQNWSCHNCGGCCRQHLIEITEEERLRIESQKWTTDSGVQLPAYIKHGTGHHLNHTADGACVFLDERGLCRIHAKFGEEAKPLACRIYPYAFHPGGKKVAVSLRFSCPSVAGNKGEALTRKSAEIESLARLVVPANAAQVDAPHIDDESAPEWPDFFRFQLRLLNILQAPGTPLAHRVLRALNWLTLIENAGTAALDGAALDEVLEMLSKAPKAAVPLDLTDLPAPNGGSRMMFRLLLVQYARKDTGSHLKRKWAYRSTLLGAGLKYALGVGKIPPLQDGFKAVPFGALEKPFGGLSAASEEVLLRHLRVKIQGIHYCGPAYYNVPFIEGFRHLALLFAATLWMARWLAAGDGRDTLLPADVLRALAVADHHHGYTPAFGSANFRRRVRTLASAGHIQKLVAWYAR